MLIGFDEMTTEELKGVVEASMDVDYSRPAIRCIDMIDKIEKIIYQPWQYSESPATRYGNIKQVIDDVKTELRKQYDYE